MRSLFTTIANANFDNASLDDFIRRAFEVKKRILDKAKEHKVALPDLTLPAFFTHDILKVLKDKFNIGTISTVEDDIAMLIDK